MARAFLQYERGPQSGRCPHATPWPSWPESVPVRRCANSSTDSPLMPKEGRRPAPALGSIEAAVLNSVGRVDRHAVWRGSQPRRRRVPVEDCGPRRDLLVLTIAADVVARRAVVDI